MAYKWNKISTLVNPSGEIKFELTEDDRKDPVFPFCIRLYIYDTLMYEKKFQTKENAISYAENIIENFKSFNDLRIIKKHK